MAKGKGKGRRPKAMPKGRPKIPRPAPLQDRVLKWMPKLSASLEPSPEPPMMYTNPETVPMTSSYSSYPTPFHPDNIISHPIRTRVQEKGPPWLQALETPKRLTGKQEEPYWMGVKDSRNEYNRAVTAYKRDELGRFLGGKGGWV